uniref:TGF-beta activated kinase 1 (MAP3K7) binding protein 3 n=2 Tax=Phasianus colchicus TaxID=9054 RepID=A0A669PYR1_PHACC
MAQGSQQLDVQVLHDLRQRFPEIPEGVVSQCMLQNNNNLDACCRALAQESNKYLYMEYHSPDDTRMNRNSLLHINLGIHPHTSYHAGDGAQLNGGRTLVHSSSDGHIDPQRTAATSTAIFHTTRNEHVCYARPSSHVYAHTSIPSNLYGTPGSIYIRQTSQSSSGRQTPQNTPWHSSPQGPVPHYSPRPLPVYPHQQNYQPSQYSPKQPQIPQSAFRSPPASQCPSPFGSPQHQVQPQLSHQSSHVFMPPSPSNVPPHPYQQASQTFQKQGSHSVSYLPPFAGPSLSKGSMNKIEITVEPPQRPGTAMNRSPSPISNQPSQRNQHPLYAATTPPSSSPSRVGRAPTENLLNLVDQEERTAAPEPIQPISVIPGSGGEKGSHKYQRSSSSGSDDYAYTQALLLHQRARMERLAKELKLEKEELERLKAEVNGMEHDLMQRRLRRVSCTTAIPTPEEMTKLRSLNRQLQINVDCTLKEVDLLQSRGNFDPKATCNFYDNIEPGPVVPPKPYKKEHPNNSKQTARTQPRDEDFEGAPWNCDSCTFLNHPALNRCEQCEMPRYT